MVQIGGKPSHDEPGYNYCMSESPATPESAYRAGSLRYSAFVGALSVTLWQFAQVVAWGGGDLFLPLPELLLGVALLAITGAICGVVAAGILSLGRWLIVGR
jgi:hypothetical protein